MKAERLPWSLACLQRPPTMADASGLDPRRRHLGRREHWRGREAPVSVHWCGREAPASVPLGASSLASSSIRTTPSGNSEGKAQGRNTGPEGSFSCLPWKAGVTEEGHARSSSAGSASPNDWPHRARSAVLREPRETWKSGSQLCTRARPPPALASPS